MANYRAYHHNNTWRFSVNGHVVFTHQGTRQQAVAAYYNLFLSDWRTA